MRTHIPWYRYSNILLWCSTQPKLYFYLPVCHEGLLKGGRRAEPAGPAWRPRDSIVDRKFMTDDSVVLLLAVLCWFESNTPDGEIPQTDKSMCQWCWGEIEPHYEYHLKWDSIYEECISNATDFDSWKRIWRFTMLSDNSVFTCGVVGGNECRGLVAGDKGLPLEKFRVQLSRTITRAVKHNMYHSNYQLTKTTFNEHTQRSLHKAYLHHHTSIWCTKTKVITAEHSG